MTGAAGWLPHAALALQAQAEPITRDGARAAARRELSRPIYGRSRPSALQRAWDSAGHWISERWHDVTSASPGGGLGVAALAIVAVIVLVLVRARLGPVRGSARGVFDADADSPLTAADLRRQADELAGRNRWADAVRVRLRALVRSLEERDVLDPRPGRTAAEVAAEVGRAAPTLAEPLWQAVEVFGEIWYGGRPATAEGYRQVVAADELAARTRHLPAGWAGGPGSEPGEPGAPRPRAASPA